MTPPALPDEDLERARHNLQRVCDFLANHSAPPADADARAAVGRLFDAVVALCERLQPVLKANGASPPRPQRLAAAAPDAAAVDAARVARFSDFVLQLEGWFAAQPDPSASAQGVEAIRTMYGALVTIRAAAGSLMDQFDAAGGPTAEVASAAAADDPAAASVGHAPDSAPPPPADVPLVRPRSDRRLLLVDLDERPLLVSFRNAVELTDTASASLSEFLDEHGIELSSYERRKLDDKVRRWIEATPDGQALVLKVGGLHGALEPFPSYIPRESVKAEIEQLRGYS